LLGSQRERVSDGKWKMFLDTSKWLADGTVGRHPICEGPSHRDRGNRPRFPKLLSLPGPGTQDHFSRHAAISSCTGADLAAARSRRSPVYRPHERHPPRRCRGARIRRFPRALRRTTLRPFVHRKTPERDMLVRKKSRNRNDEWLT
jgi:hypothetical protein